MGHFNDRKGALRQGPAPRKPFGSTVYGESKAAGDSGGFETAGAPADPEAVDELRRSLILKLRETRHSDDDQATHTHQGRPDRGSSAHHRTSPQGVGDHRRNDFRQHHRLPAEGSEDRDPRFRQLPHAGAPWTRWPQPENGSEGGSAGQENSLLQAQQGVERLREWFRSSGGACGRRVDTHSVGRAIRLEYFSSHQKYKTGLRARSS